MKRLSHEEYLNRVKEKHGNKIKILSEYKNRRTKILAKCECGHKWKTNPEPLSKGHGCPICKGNKKRTTDDFKEIVFSLVNNEYSVIGEYINKDTPIKMKHNECGFEFRMSPHSFIGGQRCPQDRYKRSARGNTYSEKKVKEKLKLLYNDEYTMVGKYVKATQKTDFLHKKCGKIFQQQPTRIYASGVGCPHCYSSKGENVIRKYLEKEGFTFKEQVRFKECKNIRPLPFDFAIYKNDKLWFLIEYDGIQHFKPKFGKKQFEATKINDEIKNRYCEENGITLIRIKYVRSENPKIFEEKVTKKLTYALNEMGIPSQVCEKSQKGVTTR